jgi:hypothetical protein
MGGIASSLYTARDPRARVYWSKPMHICLVGGIKRSAEQLVRAAEEAGHSMEAHFGDVGGRGGARLAGSIERSDLVMIVIEINSHGGAKQAKELARRSGTPFVTLRKPSVSALERFLKSPEFPRAAAG